MQVSHQQNIEKLEIENAVLKKQIHAQALKIRRLEAALVEQEKETIQVPQVSSQTIHFQQRQVEQFTYIVTHDLQEPVRTMKGFSDLIAKKYKENLDTEALGYFEYIIESSNRMSDLINGLLEYSRIGRNATLEKVNCENSLINAQNSLNILTKRSDVRIKKEQLPIISTYRREFKILLINILDNALKFRKQNEVLNISINAIQKDNFWEFSISDNGIGIEEDKLEDIFLVFRQLHHRDKYEGTGMGLTYCKKIIELNGGKIWVTSEVGVGSTFYFTIPIVHV